MENALFEFENTWSADKFSLIIYTTRVEPPIEFIKNAYIWKCCPKKRHLKADRIIWTVEIEVFEEADQFLLKLMGIKHEQRKALKSNETEIKIHAHPGLDQSGGLARK